MARTATTAGVPAGVVKVSLTRAGGATTLTVTVPVTVLPKESTPV